MARILLFLLLVSLTAGVSADTGEKFFQQALGYTVKIKTTVTLPFGRDRKGTVKGAGFVVDAKRGWVMTNAHVASSSPANIRIAVADEEYRKASKVYVDPYLDLAILQVDEKDRPGDFKVASLDCREWPAVGHPVGAFGHPWGLSYTGTRGIVSGVTTKFGAEMLQTDAPINAGNSGGPLISLRTGKIVGISTASRRHSQNTNFAVPMKYACRVLHLLQKGRDPSPPELRMTFFLDLDDRKKLIVAKTYDAENPLGLKSGDVIQRVVGEPGEIENEAQLVHALRGRVEDAKLQVLRAGEQITVRGRLKAVTRVTSRQGVYVTGVLFAPNMFQDVKDLVGDHIRVHSVEKGSLGETLEIKQRDLLHSIDSRAFEDLEEVYEHLLVAENKGEPVTLILKRWDGTNGRAFTYVKRKLTVSDLRFIGALTKDRLAKSLTSD
jgi:serine protease DegQ